MIEEGLVFLVLGVTLTLFIWGRWRYDLVALSAMLTLAIAGIIPAREAFAGLGNPAVVTVAVVLVISRALFNAGVVDLIAAMLSRVGRRTTFQIAALTGLVMVASAFMNNVGALALLMPVAIRMARQAERPPSVYLMPLAFGSLLGGMITLIGTPPNIIIAGFREEGNRPAFGMFDFTPVGAILAFLGTVLIVVTSRWLVPRRKGLASREEMFHVGEYLSEVRVPEKSEAVGRRIRDLEAVRKGDVVVGALIRGESRVTFPSVWERLGAGDILVVEADAEDLKALVDGEGLELAENQDVDPEKLSSEETLLTEAVVAPNSRLLGRTAVETRLRWSYGINLLAVARQGERLTQRLKEIRFREGDVLLIQGTAGQSGSALGELGCWPLAERDLRIGKPRRLTTALGIFVGALGVTGAGLLPVEIALSAAAGMMLLLRVLTLDEAYRSLDLPILVLLAAMLPVGQALETSGGAERIANLIAGIGREAPLAVTLTLLMTGTLLLTNVINNAAAAVLMAPVALTLGESLGISSDPLLMSVAIGSSAAFLTPIGHQASTLVMGPGGYRFGDYWRLGLPLSVLVVAVGVPAILWIWPA